MKVLLIDPTSRSVESRVVDSGREIRHLLGSKPKIAARLPNNDRLLAAPEEANGHAFSLGGSRLIVGRAVLVGKKADFGEHAPPKTDAATITRLVRWGSQQPEILLQTVSALRIDPENMVVEEVTVDGSDGGLDRALRGNARLAMRVTDNLSVFERVGATQEDFRWRKDSLVFRGLSLVVSHDRHGVLIDNLVAPKELGRSVEFQDPAGGDWVPWNHR